MSGGGGEVGTTGISSLLDIIGEVGVFFMYVVLFYNEWCYFQVDTTTPDILTTALEEKYEIHHGEFKIQTND